MIINHIKLKIKKYSTNLTESQWKTIVNILEDKRKRKHCLREIFDAIFYLVKTGCQWRMLPKDFPKWELVYYYFTKWKNNGTIDLIHEVVREKVRKKHKKKETPSVVVIDSQSVKTTRKGGENRGFDGGKKVKGRKRHIVVDTLGLLLVVVVHAANRHDSKAPFEVLEKLKGQFYRLVKVFYDGGYRGEPIDNVKNNLNFLLEVVLRTDKEEKFKILPKRWIVERTFSWFESYRRLSKDFEYHTKTSEAIVQLAMLKLMLNRLEK